LFYCHWERSLQAATGTFLLLGVSWWTKKDDGQWVILGCLECSEIVGSVSVLYKTSSNYLQRFLAKPEVTPEQKPTERTELRVYSPQTTHRSS